MRTAHICPWELREEADMRVVLLCGGKGTRLQERTETVPKPLVEIGGMPILWHVMKLYSHYGLNDFVLCLGYLGRRIKEYFLEDNAWRLSNFLLRGDSDGTPHLEPLGRTERWSIAFVDTGMETLTGGRIKRVEPLISEPTFCVTYADGLADLDLSHLLEFHRSHGKVATLTAVKPVSPFGVLEVSGEGAVTRFCEKPRMEAWVNGGFFVFERRLFDHLGPNDSLESDVLTRLAEEGELRAYRHEGFWDCMDTYKDTIALNMMWESGNAPWKLWKES